MEKILRAGTKSSIADPETVDQTKINDCSEVSIRRRRFSSPEISIRFDKSFKETEDKILREKTEQTKETSKVLEITEKIIEENYQEE